MKSVYFSFIHSYLTCGNVAWCSNSMSKTKKVFSNQKQANLNCDEKMNYLDILNICKFNLNQILNITFQVKTISIPEILQNEFEVTEHNYSTRYSEYNFKEPNIFLGLLNLQYRHMDHVCGICILTNFQK